VLIGGFVAAAALGVLAAGAANPTSSALALPACPARAAHGVGPPSSAALAFIAAWTQRDRAVVGRLADPVFRGTAEKLVAAGPPAPGQFELLRVGGLADGALAGTVESRCGAAALGEMRKVDVSFPGNKPVRMYLVKRPAGYRVWGLRDA
jgi:hypothetical protein